MATYGIGTVVFLAMGLALAWVVRQKANCKSTCGCGGSCKGGCPGCKHTKAEPSGK